MEFGLDLCNRPPRVTVKCWTCDRDFVGFIPGLIAIKWLLLVDYLQTCEAFRYITNTKMNSAFHPSRVGRSSTNPTCLAGLKAKRVHLDVGWQLIQCEHMQQVTLPNSVTGFLLRAITIFTFTFYCMPIMQPVAYVRFQHCRGVGEN